MSSSHLDRSRSAVASFKSGIKRLTVERSWHDPFRTTKETSFADSETEIEPLSSHPRVRLDNSQLVQIAHDAADKVDFQRLTDRQTSLRNWKWKTVANDFTAFSHGDGIEAAYEVLATGEMKASLNELSFILSSTTGSDHDMVMRSLYKDYIHGAVVHVVDPSLGTSSASGYKLDMESRLTVKTVPLNVRGCLITTNNGVFLNTMKKRAMPTRSPSRSLRFPSKSC